MSNVVIFILIVVNVIILLLHESADLYAFKEIQKFITNSKPTKSIYIDIYSETNDISTGRDNRLVIIQPFNWFILNSRGNIYVHSTLSENNCNNGKDTFLKLNNPLSGHSLQNINKVCLPVTISSLITYFANKIKTRLYMDTKQNTISVVDIINYLLVKGGITNSLVHNLK